MNTPYKIKYDLNSKNPINFFAEIVNTAIHYLLKFEISGILKFVKFLFLGIL